MKLHNLSIALASTPTIEGIFDASKDVIKSVTELLMAVAFLMFIWGIVRFITAAGNPEKLKTAKGYIIYGLIGVFVMFAIWGIIQLLSQTFFGGSPPTAPPGGFFGT